MPSGLPDNRPKSGAFRPSPRPHPHHNARARVKRLGAIAVAALLALPVALLAQPASAAPGKGKNPWQRVNGAPPAKSKHGHKPDMKAKRLAAFTLDRAGLKADLDSAPREQRQATHQASLVVSLPAPGGDFQRFELVESPIMEAGLAAKHPEIKTYTGRGLDDATATIRADLTPLGFHASVRSAGGAWYIDPYYHADDSVYASYFGRDLTNAHADFAEQEDVEETVAAALADVPVGPAVTLRTYRLALVTDPSYAAFFGAENVTAAKVTLINRVTQVYEDETAIRLILVNDTDKINLNTAAMATEPNGPCGAAACYTTAQLASCASSTLSRNRIVLGQLIGASNYDIGHIGLGVNGGGVASLGVVGGNTKAQGCTGIPAPVGDYYAVDYVSHEMGHQFAGNHTFNGTQYNCSGGNRNAGTSVEPGSGSSIMAYAGICQQDNLQPHSDPYWSQRSYTEITTYITSNRAAINAVQTASLYDFDTNGDSFTLRYNGNDSAPIVRGVNYTTAGIKAAIEGIAGWPAGATATVAAFGGSGTLNDTGFQVTFGGTLASTKVGLLSLTNASGASGFVGETAKGGAIDNGGFIVEPNGNHAPVVTLPASSYTIPVRTPFTLTGGATDWDGDTVTYMWEQNDRGAAAGTALVSNTKTAGPLFRQFGVAAYVTPTDTQQYHSPGENAVTTNPTRTFPDMAQIVSGNTNAKTGTCPAAPPAPVTGGATNVPAELVDCYSEFLPTSAWVGFSNDRTMHFRLTARDGHPGGGGIGYADLALVLAPAAGPFLVTSQDSASTVEGGTAQTITWDVAGTNAAPVNADRVKISFSADGGEHFAYVLADNVPNNGSATVTMPNVATTKGRIKIEAVGNVFFDVNHADITINAAPVVSNDAPSGTATVEYSDALSPTVTVTATDEDTPGSQLIATATGLPAGMSLAVASTSALDTLPGQRTWTVTGATTAAPGDYPVSVTVTDGTGISRTTSFTIQVIAEGADAVYTGDTQVFKAAGESGAPTLLRATVRDGSVLPGSTDTTAGDIRTATVTFQEGGTTLCTGTVALLGTATTEASAACTATLPAGSHAIMAVVRGNYTGTATATVTVSDPNGRFITGNGSVRPTRSAGTYPATPKSTVDLTLDAKINNGAGRTGSATVKFTSDGHQYEVRTTALNAVGVSADGTANVRYTATLVDVTNAKKEVTVATGLTLQVTATDRGAPGTSDSMGITLWNGGTLVFSSDWTGANTGELNLASGNLTAHI
ncbi:M12 family metallo-peptidase [Dactylosporangium sp. NPDC048998]|uniref:M12 family metallo-peptidase n=1 Tax=Dactylosporangium sp. NPDC048998 TaxID=3363976 RepID=UPI0037158082